MSKNQSLDDKFHMPKGKGKELSHKARSRKSGKLFPQSMDNNDATGKGAQTKQSKKLSMC